MSVEQIVSGTPEYPAYCERCGYYQKIFNQCGSCGRDERARYGCEHRIGQGGICSECRGKDMQSEAASPDPINTFLDRLTRLRLTDRDGLLALQIEATELLAEGYLQAKRL